MTSLALDATALLGPRTGIGTFVAEVLPRLARHPDVEAVTAYATTWRGRGRLAEVVADATVDVDAPDRPRTVDRPLPAAVVHRLWRRVDRPAVESWAGPVDVVHGPNYVVPPSRAAARVASVHDLTFVHHPELSTSATLAYPPLLRRAIDAGAWVHVDADFVAGEVVDVLGAPPDRVVTVPLAPSPIPDAPAGRGRALAGAERYVLALGTVEPRKDLPGLVAAFDALAADDDEVRLVVAGPDGWGADALDRAIDACHHRARVVRLGWVDATQRAALLRGATVLAYPSRYEGFGLPPLEAMSVGTPVVATDAGALPDTCGGAAQLVPVGDVDALAGALAAVVGDDGRAGELARAGEANVGRFSWEATAAGLVALYRRATA